MDTVTRKGGLLYPMLVIAAIAVIVFSAVGIATMMGWLPNALSGSRGLAPAPDQSAPRAEAGDQRPVPDSYRMAQDPYRMAQDAQPAPPAPPPATCGNCGVVESIRAVQTQGQTSWLGAAGGALIGGLLGNQIGHGGGRTAATLVGAGAGAYGGNEVEKHMNKSVRYRVRVRMDDGTYRTFHQATQPAWSVGQKVRVTERGITPAG